MHIVGHVVATGELEQFSPSALKGDGLFPLFLADYVRCHDWGFDYCFDRSADDEEAALVRAHLLADWYVHCGPETRQRSHDGWVYARAEVFTKRFDAFFEGARQSELHPNTAPRSTPIGFGHTMAEFSLDFNLCSRGMFDAQFAEVKGVLGALCDTDPSRAGSQAWLEGLIQRLEVTTDSGSAIANSASYAARVRDSDDASELAVRGCVAKFGLLETPESVDYMKSFFAGEAHNFKDEEVDDIVANSISFMNAHL